MENRKKATMEDGSREKNRVEDECRESERVKDRAREWQSDRLRGRESDRVKVKELRVCWISKIWNSTFAPSDFHFHICPCHVRYFDTITPVSSGGNEPTVSTKFFSILRNHCFAILVHKTNCSNYHLTICTIS